ncbi:hypothetical protein AVEN_202325-1 [Araneus ventricosus]|uniref:Uncharacterized protein n=1 Tax=Araneus ventricosus TaxID=182803 RepID=A0A4Y2E7S2_ARAVE|nr:hypothetical protein AVEN_202325-1 [Araneus ventricosus]
MALLFQCLDKEEKPFPLRPHSIFKGYFEISFSRDLKAKIPKDRVGLVLESLPRNCRIAASSLDLEYESNAQLNLMLEVTDRCRTETDKVSGCPWDKWRLRYNSALCLVLIDKHFDQVRRRARHSHRADWALGQTGGVLISV